MHADDLHAVSVDEALIDVTMTVNRLRETSKSRNLSGSVLPQYDPAKALAERIRSQARESTRCETSVYCITSLSTCEARKILSSRSRRSPRFYRTLGHRGPTRIWTSSETQGFREMGPNVGDLEEKSKVTLSAVLGKTTGEILYNLIRGVNERRLENDKERKSMSSDINVRKHLFPVTMFLILNDLFRTVFVSRVQKNEEVKLFLEQMGKEVANRSDAIQRCGRSTTLKVMKRDPIGPVEPPKFLEHGSCNAFNKQIALSEPGGRPIATSDELSIVDHAWRLLKSSDFDPKELRVLGIQIQKLEPKAASNANSHYSDNQGQGMLPYLKNKFGRDDTTNSNSRSAHPVYTAGLDVSRRDEPKDLPSFSQVDHSTFNALPQEIKQELESEYRSRSISPFVSTPPDSDPHQPAGKTIPFALGAARRNKPPTIP
ncbi:hypothetical protein F5877DRAFT_86503 [Lentinula edodes]|nr:hypothetical protein F5877DRAFT_86503 [Lentinula edodes]